MECKHKLEEEYYGLRCSKCGVFYPDGQGPWMPDDVYEEEHRYDCTCELCIQNHPERELLYP